MTLHSAFGSAQPPGDFHMYSDGADIALGMAFYHTGLPAGSKIAGARLWIPFDTLADGSITFQVRVGTTDLTHNLDTAATQEKTLAYSGSGKWVQALFDTPIPVPAAGTPWLISYKMASSNNYSASLNFTPAGESIPAADGSPFVVAEYVRNELTADPSRGRYFREGSGPVSWPTNRTGGYGIDTLIDIPDVAANVAPTALAGADRSVFVGQEVTLTGAGTDTDGTIASYAWEKVSGPAVTLAGATGAAIRTFTPTSTGTYVFALTVTDDGGLASEPDTITITARALPSDGPKTGKKVGSETITVVRKPKTDRLSSATATATEHDVDGCVVLPRSSFEEGKGWVTVDGKQIIAPYGADVKAGDLVRVEGVLWDVDGVPGNYRNRRAKGKATIFYLKRVGSS